MCVIHLILSISRAPNGVRYPWVVPTRLRQSIRRGGARQRLRRWSTREDTNDHGENESYANETREEHELPAQGEVYEEGGAIICATCRYDTDGLHLAI